MPEAEARLSGAMTRRNVVLFTTVVLASGWIGRMVDAAAGLPAGGETPGLLLWIAAPLATALLLRAFGGDGWRDMGLRPRIGGNLRWYLMAIAIYPVVVGVLLAVGGATGAISFTGFSGAALAGGALLALAPMFVKNLFEELAWRGYLTPKACAIGLTGMAGHVFVGLVWGLWHLPYFLFFLDRSALATYTSMPLPAFVAMAVLSMVSWAIVYGELRLLTGSVWPAVLMHMVEDSFLNELILQGHVRIGARAEWFLSPGVGLLNIALFAGLGVWLYRHRRLKE